MGRDTSEGPTVMTRRGVLLDRDGTIIVDTGYVGAVQDVVFIDGAIEAIARLNAVGLPVAVVTNQAGVARGMYELADVELVHKHMVAELARLGAHVDAWFYCPYHPDGVVAAFARTSADRKPAPGMAVAAAGALGLDLTASWVVGDSDCDVDLARAVGARAIRVGDGRADRGWDADTVADLAAAVDLILAENTAGSVPWAAAAFPAHKYRDAGVLRRRVLVGAGPGDGHRPSWPFRVGGADPRSRLPAGGNRCSRAGTADPHPSPTTSSATTSRGCGTGPACSPRAEPQHQRGDSQRDRQRQRLRERL
jgi:histidinol-phosphate phosphatase family protein